MKKIIPIIIIIFLFFIWFSNQKKKNNEQRIEKEAETVLKNTIPNTPKTLKIENDKNKAVVYSVNDEKFNYFEKKSEEWEAQVSNILSSKEYSSYKNLKEENEKEKLKAYQDYHDYLRKQQGENFKYNISEDQSIMEKKINDLYLDKLLKIIGEEKFKNYLKMKLDFNEKIQRESKGQNILIIEF